MSIKENKEVRVNLLITEELRKKYKIYCINKEIAMSERIRQLIEMDLKGEIK
jgi:hypothetical protein